MTPFAFDHVFFYGREYDEVLGMLLLDEKEWEGKTILDCPSGPSAFVAEANHRGLRAIGCDPLYDTPLEEIFKRGMADIDEAQEVIAQSGFFKGERENKDFHDRKRRALEVFRADYLEGKTAGRYVTAELPSLPFADNAFDLVISGNFLFSYSNRRWAGLVTMENFDLDFHLAAIREMMRVCRGQIRLYPIMTQDASDHLHPFAAQIIGILAAEGVPLVLKNSTYNQGTITGKLVLIIECGR